MLDLDDALDRLAPEVDTAASRDLFDRRRARPSLDRGRRRRTVLVGVAAALVLVLGTVMVTVASDREATVRTADDADQEAGSSLPPTTLGSGSIAFESLATDRAVEPMGTLRAATDADQLAELWATTGFDGAVPDVDLHRWVVVSMTIPDDACPPELTAFDRRGEVVTPAFVEPAGGCEEPLVPKTYVAAIDRTAVTPRFTLRLQAYEHFFDEQTLVVDVPPTRSGDPASPTSAPSPSSVPESERLGTVALPAVGTTGSGLLEDGTPVWVVHHPDGSVSVLPGLVGSEDVAPEDPEPSRGGPIVLTGTFEVVTAFGDSGFRSHLVDWDPWGRTITGERELDLTGYAGVVVGDHVQVIASAIAPVPGEPQGSVVGDSGDYPTVPDPLPSTPDQVTAIGAAAPGWHLLTDDVHLYGAEDLFRICPAPPGVETYSIDVLAGCAGPVVQGISGPARRTVEMNGNPFLVRVDESGEVVGVALYVISGGSWDTPTPP